jgi:hypothetical protein
LGMACSTNGGDEECIWDIDGKARRKVRILMKLLGIISVGFDVTDQLQIRSFAFVRYWRKNGSLMRQYTSYS